MSCKAGWWYKLWIVHTEKRLFQVEAAIMWEFPHLICVLKRIIFLFLMRAKQSWLPSVQPGCWNGKLWGRKVIVFLNLISYIRAVAQQQVCVFCIVGECLTVGNECAALYPAIPGMTQKARSSCFWQIKFFFFFLFLSLCVHKHLCF